MRQLKPFYLAPLLVAMLAACSDDDDDNGGGGPPPVEPESTFARVLHAAPDAPLVNITLNGENALENVDYLAGSGFVELDEGMYDIGVDAILPDGTTAEVISAPDTDLAADTEYSIIAVGKAADETLEPLVFARPTGGFGEGNIRLRVVHASPDTPAVDVYLTAPDADITAEEPTLAGVMFKDFSDLLEVPAGDYQARITLADSKDVAYDSGALSLAAGADLALVAMNNTLTGEAPVVVGAWSGSDVALIPDINAGASARAIHASPDAPIVNVLVDGVAVLNDVSYTDISDYLEIAAGDYEFAVQDAATDEGEIPLFDGPITLEQNMAYTVIAAGTLDETDEADFGGIALVEDRRRIATQTSIRLVHGSAVAGNVDIYVTADDDISDDEPAFTDVPFGADTGQVALAGGDYFVTITPTGTQDAAIGPLMVNLANNAVYTAIAADNIGGEGTLGVILADDFTMESPSSVRVLHASPDAPLVNVTVNGENELTDVDYLMASGFSELEPGTYNIGVDGILPDGSLAEDVIDADLPIMAGTQYSIIASGKVGDATIAPLVLERPLAAIGEGNARLQVVHASPDAPAVDVYLTAPGDEVGVPTLSNVAFGDSSDLLEVAAGDYQARITLTGSTDVVYDSGTVPLMAGDDLTLVAMTNTLTGASPVVVGAWGDAGLALIPDVNAGADARAIHVSPDAPTVNVLVNGAAAFEDVAYTNVTPYASVPAGDYTLGVEDVANEGTEIPLFPEAVALEQNVAYTVLAIGTLADDEFDFGGLAVMDDRRRVATEAKLRLFHASPAAGNVDIYLDDDGVITGETPAFADVPFGAETGVIKLLEGDYFVTITGAGSEEAAIGPIPVTLSASGIYTVIAADNEGVPDVLVTDDFVATVPVE